MILELEMKKRSIGSETAIGRESIIVGSKTVVVVCGSVVCGAFSPKGISSGATWLYEPLFGTAHAESVNNSINECLIAALLEIIFTIRSFF
jgi:hypothetical protein